VELQSRTKDLSDKGLGLAAISYDPPEIIAAFSKQRGITFPMLSDAGSETIKRYGILNTVAMELLGPNANDPALAEDFRTYVSVVGPNARQAGIAFPGTFVLDPSGRVKSRFFEDFYISRNTSASILMRAGVTARVPGTKISTAHLEATAYPSDTVLAPGNRITLRFDIVPRRGVHVYAPGASGYRVVAVNLETHPQIRQQPMQYPSSEMYLFKPLNERVPVYQKPFTLLQDILLDGSPQSQAALRGKESLTLNGTLNYQACDDSTCFNPESLPLSWTFTLRPLIVERPVRQP
jgi:peroxiredoxin